jgi:ATP-dependent Clp protease ATP-binding subunit ClpC
VGAGEMTSAKTLGFVFENPENEDAERRDRMMRALRSTFRPEFLNRIDEFIIFNSLTEENIAKIAHLMLDEVVERCRKIGISLSFSPSATKLLAKKGFDQNWGARPLRRTVTRLVEDALATDLLEGKFKAGDTVEASVRDEKIHFEKK